MKPVTALCCLCVALCLASSTAGAGVIRGVLRIKGARVASAASTARGRVPAAVARQLNPGSGAIIYLDSIPEKVEKKLAKSAGSVTIGQAYGEFIPKVAAVPAGDTVVFENHDRVYHNAFSVSPTRKFDIGKYAPRQSRRVVFNRPGTVSLFCDIDPGESGYIVVVPNHAWTTPGADGLFELPKLPAGRYRLHVWHPSKRPITKDVEIPKRGDVALDLRM